MSKDNKKNNKTKQHKPKTNRWHLAIKAYAKHLKETKGSVPPDFFKQASIYYSIAKSKKYTSDYQFKKYLNKQIAQKPKKDEKRLFPAEIPFYDLRNELYTNTNFKGDLNIIVEFNDNIEEYNLEGDHKETLEQFTQEGLYTYCRNNYNESPDLCIFSISDTDNESYVKYEAFIGIPSIIYDKKQRSKKPLKPQQPVTKEDLEKDIPEPTIPVDYKLAEIKEKARISTLVEELRKDVASGLITREEYKEMFMKLK